MHVVRGLLPCPAPGFMPRVLQVRCDTNPRSRLPDPSIYTYMDPRVSNKMESKPMWEVTLMFSRLLVKTEGLDSA